MNGHTLAPPLLLPALLVLLFFPITLPAAHGSGEENAPLARITVDAGRFERIDTPLSVALDGVAFPLDAGIRLVEVTSDAWIPVPSQLAPGAAPRLAWILDGTTAAGAVRTFILERDDPSPAKGNAAEAAADAAPAKDGAAPAESGTVMRAVDDGRHLDLLAGEGRILRYNHAPVPPPEGTSPLVERSGFIHPLWSPAGAELTRIHPADHVHHVGLWNPFTKTRFEGREVDFWNLKKGKGTVRFARFLTRGGGPVFARFRALQEHVDLSAPGGEKTALDEEWDVRAWAPGGKDGGSYLVDFTSTLRCATESPVLLLKYRYGGLGFRATASFDKGDYLTSEGKTRKDGQGTRARWCRVAGPTAEGPAGVLFMSHPQNHAHPEPMRIWSHTAPIFFSFCPIQKADWPLEPGSDYVLRYRMLVYSGTLSADEAERAWADFGHPPAVTLTAAKPIPGKEK